LPNASTTSFSGLATNFQGGQISQDDDDDDGMGQIGSFFLLLHIR
jgi:hypothetical protein